MVVKSARLEILVSATAVLCVLAIVLGRAERVSDSSLAQAVSSAAAHFQAGLSILQVRSRLQGAPPLNALGYPTGLDGELTSDGDCESIWNRVMNDAAAGVVVPRFVDDHDGGGDRCEYVFFDGVDSGEGMRILYWPDGSMAAVVTVDQRLLKVPHGGHVYVDLG